MIDRSHGLPLTRQAEVLKLSRSGLYYRPRLVSPADLAVMRRIDELHLAYPFAGSRMLRDLLRGEGIEIGRQHVATLMRRMGIEAIYRRPHTSKPAPGHKIRSGRWTSPTSRWHAASSISPSSSTGSAAGFWPGRLSISLSPDRADATLKMTATPRFTGRRR